MSGFKLHRVLLLANIPVGLFMVMVAWASLFGLGIWDWIRGISIMSPILLAAWLAVSTYVLQNGQERLAIALAAFPVIGLVGLLTFTFAVKGW
jgi:hypothetical protein